MHTWTPSSYNYIHKEVEREKQGWWGNNHKGGNVYGFDQNILYAFMKFSIKLFYKVIQTWKCIRKRIQDKWEDKHKL